ncbi:MAG: ParB/RepB/Spo0J family partition protein [Acidimicrobiia bacterium]|nr:ParB/RepB/Spo0J family partition protein [Acidimicrobiia bacterium]
MTQQKRRSGLGKGLEALIPVEEETAQLLELGVDDVAPNPEQPRRMFDADELEALAASIREVGVLQPIVVQSGEDGYHLIAGERRLRASRIAGLQVIPAVVRSPEDDSALLSEALIENVQREDLRPLEEAAAYQELVERFELTHAQVGERVGKSRAAISNTLRLLGLPASVQEMVDSGALAAGHARALLGLDDAAYLEHIAKRAADEGWSVRQVEEAVRARDDKVEIPVAKKVTELRPPALQALEERLAEKLGTKVKITHKGDRGRVVISYSSLDDLENLSRIVYDL